MAIFNDGVINRYWLTKETLEQLHQNVMNTVNHLWMLNIYLSCLYMRKF
ncbi:hypothetical protein GM3708_2353 [Geminocystis sp. NIES-3708]|nr:hypothetical protein GM3708_2353 [Geminocystis sp. NIES-3708]